MRNSGPASLSGSLIARKGEAAPASQNAKAGRQPDAPEPDADAGGSLGLHRPIAIPKPPGVVDGRLGYRPKPERFMDAPGPKPSRSEPANGGLAADTASKGSMQTGADWTKRRRRRSHRAGVRRAARRRAARRRVVAFAAMTSSGILAFAAASNNELSILPSRYIG